MDIVLIGTGNTATVLGKKLKEAGHTILQIYGRNASDASELAYILDSESTNYWSVVSRDADIYILAVSDIAIEELLQELHLPRKTIVHTAASVSKNILQSATSKFGVFYPLQTLKKDANVLPEIPMIIDASDPQTLDFLESLAETISDKVVQASDEQRLKLHLAAVFCNNFVNHLYALMEDYCRKENLDFQLLIPLIKETTASLDKMPASQAQTGPGIRHDDETLKKHIHLLEQHPHLKEVYILLTKSIQQQS